MTCNIAIVLLSFTYILFHKQNIEKEARRLLEAGKSMLYTATIEWILVN